MKLSFLKIDKFEEKQGFQSLFIPSGGVQIKDGRKTLANSEGIWLQMNTRRFLDVTKEVDFDVYFGNAIFPVGEERHALINLLAVEGLVNEIYKQLEEK